MIKRGTQSRRGRKPAIPNVIIKDDVDVIKTPSVRKTRGSAIRVNALSNENKITVYFGTKNGKEGVTCEDNGHDGIENGVERRKSIALQMVFGKCVSSETSPHKILLKKEVIKTEVSDGSKRDIVSPLVEKEDIEPPKLAKINSTKATPKLNDNQSLNKDVQSPQNHKLTEYFTVRRSVRKPKNVIMEEKQKCLENAVHSGKEDGLQIHVFPGKGRGIITTRLFRKGEFVVEYSGDLIDMNQAKIREKLYSADQNTGCYMYYFQHKNQSYCVDATAESSRLGRLVNHSRAGNLAPKVIEIEDRPHLLLVARSDILPGKELLYDYGDRSSLSLKHHPWLAS